MYIYMYIDIYIYIYVYAGSTVDPMGFEPRVLNKYTYIRCILDQQWTHWDLNPGPSACKAMAHLYTMSPLTSQLQQLL